nr:hypothetical protein [Tanacetum cinerariifolium]
MLLLWSSISSTYKSSDGKAKDDKPTNDTGSKTVVEPVNKEDQAYIDELDRLMSQEKDDAVDALRKALILTNRVHIDHPKDQILGDPKSAVQTRGMAKKSSRAHAFVSYIHKKRRTNHKDYESYLFVCFLSHMEPKKVAQALDDEKYVEAMQVELFAYDDDLDIFNSSVQSVGAEADLNNMESSTIVYRNKKDDKGIVVRNKARLVAQGHIQEEEIDYDK